MPKASSLDERFGNQELIVWAVKVVNEQGRMWDLVFPKDEKHKARQCFLDFFNSDDVTFVSLSKRLMETGEQLSH